MAQLARSVSDMTKNSGVNSFGNGSVGRSCTLTDYFSGHGRLRVRPHSFTSTLLLPPLHEKKEAQISKLQPAKTYLKAKYKFQVKALEEDKALQKEQLGHYETMRKSQDETEPVLRQRIELLFSQLPEWQVHVPEAIEGGVYDDPGLRFQLNKGPQRKMPEPERKKSKNDDNKEDGTRQTPPFDLDEGEKLGLQNCIISASIRDDPNSNGSKVLRPTFCRFLLDLEVCDQQNLHYHWCVNKFDEYALSDTSTPHRYVTLEVFGHLMEVILSRKITESTKDHFFSVSLPQAENEAEQRHRRFHALANRYAENQLNRLTKDEESLLADPVLSQLRNMDVTRQFPPVGMSQTEYQSMMEKEEDAGAVNHPQKLSVEERRSNAETKLAVQLEVLDIMCEPEAIHFLNKFSSLLENLFYQYHDMSEERVRSLLPDEKDMESPSRRSRLDSRRSRMDTSSTLQGVKEEGEGDERGASPKARGCSMSEEESFVTDVPDDEPQITGHMNFPCFLQFCSDFQLFPKLAGYAELRFLYETAVSCELPPCKAIDEEGRGRSRRSTRPASYNAYVSSATTSKLPLFDIPHKDRSYAEAKAYQILHALCDWMDARIGRVQDVFALFDTDRSWTISAEEFLEGIKAMRIYPLPSVEEVAAILRVIDSNYDGMIQLSELERAITATMAYRKEKKQEASNKSLSRLKVEKPNPDSEKPDLGMGDKPPPNNDEVAMRFLKLEDNSSQHCPRQIEVPVVNGRVHLALDGSRPATPGAVESEDGSTKLARRLSSVSQSHVGTPTNKSKGKGEVKERRASSSSVVPAPGRMSRSESDVTSRRTASREGSRRRGTNIDTPEVDQQDMPVKKMEKRWRIFGPVAFSEVLLRIAVEYLTFHGNPVQQRCSAYSKGIWLLTHLNSVFQSVTESLTDRPSPRNSEDTTFVRPLHGLVWSPDGTQLFYNHPQRPPPAATVDPHVSDEELSDVDPKETEVQDEAEEKDETRPNSKNGGQAEATRPNSKNGKKVPATPGSTKTGSRGSGKSTTPTKPRDKGTPQAAAAMATMRMLDEKQQQERLIEMERRKLEMKRTKVMNKRFQIWNDGSWGSPHNWKTSVVDRHQFAAPGVIQNKLLRRQSRTHTYLLSVEKWLSTMGPARDYWMTPQPKAIEAPTGGGPSLAKGSDKDRRGAKPKK
jgi:hypothetical protein